MNRSTALPRRLPTRLALTLLLAAGLVAACGDKASTTALAPAEIERGTACELDGMLLADYPGPKGQIRFANVAEVQWFCDTTELLSTLLAPEQVRTVVSAFVQDMAKADWEQPRGHWIDARQAVYVLGSRRKGSMGPTAISFASDADAQAFVQQQGGRALRFAEIQPAMVDLSGGAQQDTRM